MSVADGEGEVESITAMMQGDQAALAAFKSRHERLLRDICRSVSPDQASAEAVLRDLIASHTFASEFAGYRGRGEFSTFATKVLVDGFLFHRLLALIRRDRDQGMIAFEAFFRRRLHRIVAARIEDRELQRDARQWVLEQVLRNERQQLAIWAEQARAPGFVVTKLTLLASDFLRSSDAPSEVRRRDLPEAIAALTPFDRAVFAQFYWYHAASAREIMYGLVSFFPGTTELTVLDARIRVQAALKSNPQPFSVDVASADEPAGDGNGPRIQPSIEPTAHTAIEDAEAWEFLRAALFRATIEARLSRRERQYLELLLDGQPSRCIAKKMGEPVEAIYKMARNVRAKLRTQLLDAPAAKNLMASVTGNDAFLEPRRSRKGEDESRASLKGLTP